MGKIEFNQPIYKTLIVPGRTGYSAYELAVKEGFEGTVEEWLQSLVWPQGIEELTDYDEYVAKRDASELDPNVVYFWELDES